MNATEMYEALKSFHNEHYSVFPRDRLTERLCHAFYNEFVGDLRSALDLANTIANHGINANDLGDKASATIYALCDEIRELRAKLSTPSLAADLREALREILDRTNKEKARDPHAAIAGGILEIHDIANTALAEFDRTPKGGHGNADWKSICAACAEGTPPKQCEWYGEPDGCNAPNRGRHSAGELPGNAAALRSSLTLARDTIEAIVCGAATQIPFLASVVARCDTALDTRPRNSDRFQTETDAQLVFLNDVWLISVDKETMLEQYKYENWTEKMKTGYARWLLAPAEKGAES